MSWKDDVLNLYLPELLEILGENAPGYHEIIFLGNVDTGVVGASAIFYDERGDRKGLANFRSVAGKLQDITRKIHAEFAKQGENWKLMKVSFGPDDSFAAEFDYEDPDRWSLHDFPEHLKKAKPKPRKKAKPKPRKKAK